MTHDRCVICGAPAIESLLSQAGVCRNCINEGFSTASDRWREAAQAAQKRFIKGIRQLSAPEEED